MSDSHKKGLHYIPPQKRINGVPEAPPIEISVKPQKFEEKISVFHAYLSDLNTSVTTSAKIFYPAIPKMVKTKAKMNIATNARTGLLYFLK